jgi:hypothetical protein
MIYSTNLSVAKEAAKKLKQLHITRFHSQNALYIFMEDIKNPFLKKCRGNDRQPSYAGNKNYEPSIGYLQDKGIFTRNRVANRIEIEVNKEALENYLNTI